MSSISSYVSPASKNWNYKGLLLCHLLVAILGTSLFFPLFAGAWSAVDIFFFKALNGTLKDRPLWQAFWAMANHKLADWVEDIVFIVFFIFYVKAAQRPDRLKKVANLLFIVTYSALIIYFVNRLLFRETLNIPRASPTLVVESSIKLSEHISWLKIKDDSSKSFPGDHGTTALLFTAAFCYLGTKKQKVLACLYGTFLCLPRLITGAHWLSDVIVGSGSIVLFFLSWAYCTPLAPWCSRKIEELLKCCLLFKEKWGRL